MSAWLLRALLLWVHLAGAVVWFGAVTYLLLGSLAAYLGLLLHG